MKEQDLLKAILVAVLTAGSFVCIAAAEPDAKAEGCIFDGPKFAWIIPSPDGWTLSCISDEHPEVPIALWPSGSTWRTARVVMYINPTSRGAVDQTLADFVAQEVKQFEQRNPTVTVVPGAPVETGSDGKAIVRHITGDRWGNVESIAYIDTTGPFAVVVLSAKDQALHDSAYEQFKSLVGHMTSAGDRN